MINEIYCGQENERMPSLKEGRWNWAMEPWCGRRHARWLTNHPPRIPLQTSSSTSMDLALPFPIYSYRRVAHLEAEQQYQTHRSSQSGDRPTLHTPEATNCAIALYAQLVSYPQPGLLSRQATFVGQTRRVASRLLATSGHHYTPGMWSDISIVPCGCDPSTTLATKYWYQYNEY